jgi:hypothetical protein
MKTRILYDCYASPVGSAPNYVHPDKHLADLGEKLGFRVIDAQPQPMTDSWIFWVEHEQTVKWPHYISPREWREPK